MMDNLFENIAKIASTIGEKFNVIFLSILSDIDIETILLNLNSEIGKRKFEKLDNLNYKFIKKDDREKYLKELTNEERENIFKKHKESLVKTIIEETNYLLQQETRKLQKEQVIKIFTDLIEYLINEEKVSFVVKYLDYIISIAYKNSENYERLLILKSKIELRKNNYEEVSRLLNQINIYPEFIVRKYEILIEMNYQKGNIEEIEKIKKSWIEVLDIYKIYNESIYVYRTVEYMLRMSKYAEVIEILLNKINEIESLYRKSQYPILSKILGDIYNVLGNCFYERDNYNEAIKYYLSSVEYYKKNNFEREVLYPYNNIAEIYKAYKKYDKSLSIYRNIYQTSKSLGEKEVHSISLWNIGEIYFFMNDFENAYKYFSEAEKLLFSSGLYSKYENYIKIFFSKLYFETNQFELAKEYVDEVLLSAYEKKQMKEYADALVIKGKLVAKNNEDPIPFFNEAIDIYKELKLENEIKDVEKLKIVYKKL
ncbi:MAG: tetratricopeptide repeat protein [Spirochaetes bacterium]|nr:tetratricopeptide repeat protein [Spirochaetota bacterium]